MADPPAVAPNSEPDIYRILQTLGMSRDDLNRCTVEMRQFLASGHTSSFRAFSQDRSDVHDARRAMSTSLSRSRSASVTNASLPRFCSPSPATPVKSEYLEPTLPATRTVSIMDAAVNKARKELKKQKREKERKRLQQPSPSPARSSVSLDAFMNSRPSMRVPTPESRSESPELPNAAYESTVSPSYLRHYRHYEEPYSPRRSEMPPPSSSRAGSPPPLTRSVTFPIPKAPPVTPQKQGSYYRNAVAQSTPDYASQASSSPVRIVNIVSSPVPLGPPPPESEYDTLPFKLPPGPYSPSKPAHSYAALIGQAILASPHHRLSLQDIYEFITIVYPHFQRGVGEQTWMNSIRHVLSTTDVFRKVNRDERDDAVSRTGPVGKPKGRSLWAVWDEDLECFKNGSFDKRFCKDMVDGSAKSKKRGAEDSGSGSKKASKRARKSGAEADSAGPSGSSSSAYPQLVPISHVNPLFPPLPGSRNSQSYTTHQPYYPVYNTGNARHQMSAEVYFPPLPDYYKQIPSHPAARSSTSRSSSYLDLTDVDSRPVSPPLSSASSAVPDLIPHHSTSGSSSPPLEDESQGSPSVEPRVLELERGGSVSPTPSVASFPGLEDMRGDVFGDLGPSINLKESIRKRKAPQRPPPRPESPLSISVRSAKAKGKAKVPARTSTPPPTIFPRMGSPVGLPQTPPRKRKTSATATALLSLSPVRTPISHKGLNMSPSLNLSYYKTHLDPPAPHPVPDSSEQPTESEEAQAEDEPERPHTPEKRSSTGLPFLPVTPQRLSFPTTAGSGGSPFRSPFRGGLYTPGADIYDPVDPATILNDELTRLGTAALQDSPVGLYGSAVRGLLYESPDASSPGRFARYW